MAAAETPCSEFMNWELETSSSYGLKQEKQLSAPHRRYYSFCRRKSFAAFVASKRSHPEEGASWSCCGQTFKEHSAVHKHVARTHNAEVQQLTRTTFKQFLTQMEEKAETQRPSGPKAEPVDISAWIPEISHISEEQLKSGPGKVLLYYRYCQVEDPQAVCEWQKALCEKLHLTGKVRVAAEGINGTVGGTNTAADVYIDAMLSHPVFKMEKEDFKISDGSTECFTDLRVGVFKEIVPMGVDPDIISYKLAGVHLEPEEFHREVEAVLANGDSDTVLLDCRNFYESKIGRFSRCLAPDIRKFSYFPDYVDRNLDLFRNKRVLMYCTGGVRCERGSAYLRSKDVCREVLQLKGGIHKYLERFPDGFYRGKLFVFDERFAISSNDDVISACRYCGRPWDRYQLCSTRFCSQLVLSCAPCRRNGRTACCPRCQAKGEENPHPPGEENPQPPGEENHREGNPQPPGVRNPQGGNHREECECTDRRPRIPQDV